jgi:hypothetical protein
VLCPAPGLARVFLEPQITGWLRQRLICLDRPCDGTLLKCRGILGARGLTQPPHLCRGGVAVSPCVRKSIATSHQSKSAATRKPESRMTRKWHVRFGGGRGEKAARTSLVAYPTLLHTRFTLVTRRGASYLSSLRCTRCVLLPHTRENARALPSREQSACQPHPRGVGAPGSLSPAPGHRHTLSK